MANEANSVATPNRALESSYVYAMAAFCLAMGVLIGFVLHGSPSSASTIQPATGTNRLSVPGSSTAGGHIISLEQAKQTADARAVPLLQKLKSDPNNSALLGQLGSLYHSLHQFKDAAAYFNRAVQLDSDNVTLRTKLAISLYRDGDADGAIAQLNQALARDPGDANVLFNLGTIKLREKHDGKGALAAWRQLLQSNPQLSADRKATVLNMIAEAQTMMGDQN